MKRQTALYVSIAMAATLSLSACGTEETPKDVGAETPATEDGASQNEGGGAISFPLRERVTLQAVAARPSLAPSDFNDQPLVQALESKTNVHVEWDTIVETDYIEKRNLLLASGTLPDF
ncbi:MAG TPA: hypothetical protein VEZ72_06400, partial [Paenibacillus sp.]|nr:hypothetical protein [Paenibacillus sp.]